jgi:hypothetical protein
MSIEIRVLKASPSAEAPSPRSTSLSFKMILFATTKPGGVSEERGAMTAREQKSEHAPE